MLIPGDMNVVTVVRKTDIGYVLTKEGDEVFLHNNESMHQVLNPNDKIEVFLYFDFKGRLSATLAKPFVTIETQAFLTVVEVNESLGVFLDMGISKDVLLSKDDLPLDYALWPKKLDKIYVTLRVKNKLIAKRVSKNDIQMTQASKLHEKEDVSGYVQKIGKDGLNILTENKEMIFVHHTMYKGTYRLGQEVHVKIIHQSDKGFSGSLLVQKEVVMFDDANMILSYLIRNKHMSLTADSTPEAIEHQFKMSKKAFKRALGHLYKERKIYFVEGKTILVE